MPKKFLDDLQKSLELLKQQNQARVDRLQSQLAKKEPISSEDEDFLDQQGNFVDEEALLEFFRTTRGAENALEGLTDKQKCALERLKGVQREDVVSGPTNGRKRELDFHQMHWIN
jgi:hypothetical protein